MLSCVLLPTFAFAYSDIVVSDLLGLPAGFYPISVSLEKSAAELRDHYYRAFNSLSEKYQEPPYNLLKGYKAVAACLNEPPNILPSGSGNLHDIFSGLTKKWVKWGKSFECENEEEALHKAVEACKKSTPEVSQSNCTCTPVLKGDSGVLALPVEYITAYALSKTEAHNKTNAMILEMASKSLLLRRSIDSISRIKKIDGIESIHLNLKRPVKFGYPDADRDYAAACQKRFLYALIKVQSNKKAEVLADLNLLIDIGLYDCYSISVNTTDNPRAIIPGRIMEDQCRYVARVASGEELSDSWDESFPTNIAEAMKTEKIVEAWGEGVVRVDSRGIPLVVRDEAWPLAIRTEKDLYLGVELILPNFNSINCLLGTAFSRLVFDISACQPIRECSIKVAKELVDSIEKSFSQPPFESSKRQSDKPLPPGEIIMERHRKPSLILGRPYYELSTYTIETWSTDSTIPPPGSAGIRQEFKGIHPERILFYLTVNHVVTLSVNHKGIYSEPEREQGNKYTDTIRQAIKKSINQACDRVGGKVIDDVCVVKGRIRSSKK